MPGGMDIEVMDQGWEMCDAKLTEELLGRLHPGNIPNYVARFPSVPVEKQGDHREGEAPKRFHLLRPTQRIKGCAAKLCPTGNSQV